MSRTALLALLLAGPLTAEAASKRPGLAVMDIRAVQGVQAGTATLITDVVVTEVSVTRRFDVISSADISSLLGLEKQRQLLQCGEDSSCLAELGGALGVDVSCEALESVGAYQGHGTLAPAVTISGSVEVYAYEFIGR